MSEEIATLFIWLVLLGPAAYCVVLHYRTKGERPSREGMALALMWTAAWFFHRQLKWDETQRYLRETCEELEAAHAKIERDPDGAHASGMMSSECELAQGHAEVPVDEPS